MLLTTKQSKGESIEHFFRKLKEPSENCELGNQEDTLIRNLFIANMQNPEIQRAIEKNCPTRSSFTFSHQYGTRTAESVENFEQSTCLACERNNTTMV